MADPSPSDREDPHDPGAPLLSLLALPLDAFAQEELDSRPRYRLDQMTQAFDRAAGYLERGQTTCALRQLDVADRRWNEIVTQYAAQKDHATVAAARARASAGGAGAPARPEA